MRRQEFRARDKKIQKMTHDGLTEHNLTQGTKQRISNRVAEVSFVRNKYEDKLEKFCNISLHKKARKQLVNIHGNINVQNYLPPKQEKIVPFADVSVSKIHLQNSSISIHDTFNKTMKDNHVLNTQSSLSKEIHKKWHKQKLIANKESQRQNPKAGIQLETNGQRTFTASEEYRKLKFEANLPKEPVKKDCTTMKKKLAVKFVKDGTKPESKLMTELGNNRKLIIDDEKSEKKYLLETSKGTKDIQENYTLAKKEPEDKSKQQKKMEKAQQKVENICNRLEKAREKLPTHHRICFSNQYNCKTGKIKHRLHFETEIISENQKASFQKKSAKAVGQIVTTKAMQKLHQKIRETERDNVGVEAAHKTEIITENGLRWYLRKRKRSLHDKPYRKVHRTESRLIKANINMEYQKLLKDNPKLQKNTIAKWYQKQRIKRKYAISVREAIDNTQHTTNVLATTGQKVRALAQTIATKKTLLGIVAIEILFLSLFGTLFSSCSAMLTSIQSAIISTCYVADDTEINAAELTYTELETDLQITINNTEDDYPGYDEYQYSIGEIGHNPYELIGYLSAMYDDFTYAQVESELFRLFDLQYQLTREDIVETRTYIDEEGEEQEYEWKILKTTLLVNSLSEIIEENLPAGDPFDRYGIYMQTCGNRQCYGNPFDFAWIPYITSPYGYRIHPISGEKNLHRGIDIGASEGTSILAIQDGRVLSAGDAGTHGLCIIIEGDNGYRSKYAHCSSIFVSVGQEVKRGNVIATVGNTGNSTGAHLHLETTHNGDYLNPYFYVDNGGNGYHPNGIAATIPDFSENPDNAMGNGSFEAMLHEAEKFLGYPYVWGGSSPSTSFDCSGYVSWVINHSGVGNVGRQTAQGLYNLCTPITRAEMQPGDLVFFTGTYSTANPVTHVGIYVGGEQMVHCGCPISYANIDKNKYWASHFYSGGRLP